MKAFNVRSIRFRIGILLLLFGAIVIAAVYFITFSLVTRLEETLIASRLNADINYIEDLIGDGEWNIRDDAIYLGDTLVGDGTDEKANLAPFLEHEEKTGTFSYVFIKCGDEGLGYVESTPTAKGYQEGHFLRVAGSTRDPDGKSIVGTYMDVLVADVLDAEDTYGGEANVAGGMIYCRYNTLKDVNGTVVGAIVVGRNISELQAQVGTIMQMIIIAIVVAVILALVVMMFIINRWTRALEKITQYLKTIAQGTIPEEPLSSNSTGDEIDTLIDGVNRMAETLRENETLRVKSETDQLTGLLNRFGLNRIAEEVFERCYKEQRVIGVGIMDIDFFKPYNDHYGHTEGDKCIIMIADVLKEFAREQGVHCCRFGGDEFVIICEGYPDEEIAGLAKRIRARVEDVNMPHAYSEVASHVTISQGYCFGIPMPHQKLNDYIHMADGALYEIKKGEKNDFRVVEMTTDFRPQVAAGVVSLEYDTMTRK